MNVKFYDKEWEIQRKILSDAFFHSFDWQSFFLLDNIDVVIRKFFKIFQKS